MTAPSQRERAVTPLMAILLVILLLTIQAQVTGASHGLGWLSVFAGAAFTGAIVRVAWQLNRPWWTPDHDGLAAGPDADAAEPQIARRNAGLLALAYAWGGASLLAVYTLSPLRWQHGWQYGLGMLLIAVVIFAGSRLIERRWSKASALRLITVSLVHGGAAAVALSWLILSNKFMSPKSDWAANVVFVCGAIIIGGISAIGIRTARLMAEARDKRPQR